MNKDKIYNYRWKEIYALYLAKVIRKGHTQEELDEVLCRYTNNPDINQDVTLGEWIDTADKNPARLEVKGKICGVDIESIEDAFMKEVRILDKLVDNLSKQKPTK